MLYKVYFTARICACSQQDTQNLPYFAVILYGVSLPPSPFTPIFTLVKSISTRGRTARLLPSVAVRVTKPEGAHIPATHIEHHETEIVADVVVIVNAARSEPARWRAVK